MNNNMGSFGDVAENTFQTKWVKADLVRHCTWASICQTARIMVEADSNIYLKCFCYLIDY